MAVQAKSIIHRCVDILQDSTSVRWPIEELIRYLNDAQREVALYRPDAMVTNYTYTCVLGSKQVISASPISGSKLIDVVRNNTTSSKRSVRMVNREILDAQHPEWHEMTASAEVKHFMYDPRDPTVFYVYPPASTAAKLDIVYSKYPTEIADGNGTYKTWDEMPSTEISVPDIYSNVIQDYVLYRAYSKDSEYAGNAQRAQAHYGAFANALGIEIQATVQVAPNPISNPNMPMRAAPAQ
jgi:hypothetical protein